MNEKNVGPVDQADPKTCDYLRCIDFHGHDCSGLATGFRAARVALAHLRLIWPPV
ncbi:MAG: formylmethanofuran dehydrogenase subunit E family protein [Proteobacteria bacterium]|nr:formylmethanofuran dehydrogenase subunit E family protein [Pseudomonadota bacterium]MBU2226916.1 formylmethanofuran dehydrogenase subunit E family protein [Pseudomonadota bacterium]MBU2260470.1 formylmethanofuran dehydrogenase subunit E family protein [Pseudomonadota bacterium]